VAREWQRSLVEDPGLETCDAQSLPHRVEHGLLHYQYSARIEFLHPLRESQCSLNRRESPLSRRHLVDRKFAGVYEEETKRLELFEHRSFVATLPHRTINWPEFQGLHRLPKQVILSDRLLSIEISSR